MIKTVLSGKCFADANHKLLEIDIGILFCDVYCGDAFELALLFQSLIIANR